MSLSAATLAIIVGRGFAGDELVALVRAVESDLVLQHVAGKMALKPSLAKNASHEAWAEAMMRCQAYSPNCAYLGECAHDGDCFRSEKRCVVEARRAILRAAEGVKSEDVANLVRDAANLLVERHNREAGAVSVAGETE